MNININVDQRWIDRLKTLAARNTWREASEESGDEDFVVDDYAGGNVDDAYDGGIRDGETTTARDVLDCMNIKWS